MYTLARIMAEAVQKQALNPATSEQELRDQLINMCELSVKNEELIELLKKGQQIRDDQIANLESQVQQLESIVLKAKRLVDQL